MTHQKMIHELDHEIKNLLLENEQIILSALQNQLGPGGSMNTPNTIYVTNMHLIIKNPKGIGRQ